MPKLTFDCCALQYLNQWLEHDKKYYEDFNNVNLVKSDKLNSLKAAATFYKIARNLPTSFEKDMNVERYQPVLDILETISIENITNNVIEELNRVRKSISLQYGGRDVLSLTSKLLWLKFRSPIIIYDSKVRQAVGAFNNNYEDYCKKWNDKYKEHELDIEIACIKLHEVKNYCIDPDVATQDYIKEIAKEKWFRERVLDIYLWSI